MEAPFAIARWPRWRTFVACGFALAVAVPAAASTFSARETHAGLVIDGAGGATGRVMPRGWFRRAGEPTFVYRGDGGVVAGIWETGPDAAVVRNGTSEDAPLVGRIVPSWNDNALWLTIEPASGAAVRTSVFQREGGGGSGTLDRDTSSRVELEGTYRATLRGAGGSDAGWLSVTVDPEGGTRFTGDLPSSIPPPLAAAVAAAIDGEVSIIYANSVDVAPLRR